MDLKSANQAQQSSTPGKKTSMSGGEMPASGFGGLSKRNQARKPVIAAVNGFALGTVLHGDNEKFPSRLNPTFFIFFSLTLNSLRRRYGNCVGMRYSSSHSEVNFRTS
jgi:hypothetical protein